ncbi:S-adenosyl-L-methionine-dependent methyltransferase [Aspergillus insuetus]
MDDIIVQIRALASGTDVAGRAKLQNALREVLSELESPHDILVQLFNAHLNIATVRLAIDLGLFKLLSSQRQEWYVEEMAEKLDASPQMLERIVRYLASTDIIGEDEPGIFRANKITHILSDQKAEAFVHHAFDICGPALQAFPDFFRETKYADITSNTSTPFQKAFDTDLTSFAWISQHPEHLNAMQQVMTAFRSSEWLADFELFEKEALATAQGSRRVFFVDVGGGYGHQCIEVRNRFPNLEGQLVLQDLPEVFDGLADISGVKIEACDFFQPQTVKGAKFYYLRRILHDWPDALCVKILQRLRYAMASDSKILIDEIVLPGSKIPWQSAMADLMMMITLGGKERSKEQWIWLVEQSGLQVEHIHKYDGASTFNSVVVLGLDQI